MNTNRKIAVLVGIFFIIGTVSGILSALITGPIFETTNFLMKISQDGSQVVLGAFFVLSMGLALVMVPVMMYPIFKKYDEILALGSVVFRGVLETVTYIAMVISWLLLILLSQEYVKAGASEVSYFQTLGTILMKANDQIIPVQEIVFSLGALMFYYLFWVSKLIPRWLSGWGLIGAGIYLIAGLITLFGYELDVLLAPLAVQEMILALWLIIKGFNPTEVPAGANV